MAEHYLQHLMSLIGSKKFFASYEFMKNLPPDTAIPNKQNLFADLESKVNRARLLTREVNRLLNRAAYPSALANLQKAKHLVPDFPNIQNDIDFIEGTITTMQQSLTRAEQAATKGEQKKVRELLDTAHKIDTTNIAIARIEKKLRKSLQKRQLRNMVLTGMAILTPFCYVGYEHLLFMKSSTQWQQANQYVGNQQFHQAKGEIAKVESALQSLHLLHQPEKIHILARARIMMESPDFQQGLAGKLRHGDDFIERSTKKQIDQLAALRHKAEESVARQNWSVALDLYQQALKVALLDEKTHQGQIKELQRYVMQIRDTMYVLHQEEGRESFRNMVKLADIFFKERRWSEAMATYGESLRFARENRIADYDVVKRVGKSHQQAEINNALEEAQALLSVNKEAEARIFFEKIIALTEEHGLSDRTAMAVATEMIGRIDKNRFLSKVNDLEERARTLQAEKKFNEALAHYQEMLSEIQAHSAQFNLNMDNREGMIKAAMEELGKEEVVTSQYRFLLSAYQNILRKTFNLSSNVELKQPEVIFLKTENNVLLYKVSALGPQDAQSKSPQTRYEVDYKFDLATGTWALNATPAS